MLTSSRGSKGQHLRSDGFPQRIIKKNKVKSRRDSSRNLLHLLGLDFGSSSLELTGGDLQLTLELSCSFVAEVSEQHVESYFVLVFFYFKTKKKTQIFLI